MDNQIVKHGENDAEKIGRFSLEFVAFLQSFVLLVYCSLIGVVLWNAGRWLAPIISPAGPILLIMLFVASAMICALSTLGLPFLIFWEEKNTTKALKLVLYTTGWLVFLILIFIALLLYSKR